MLLRARNPHFRRLVGGENIVLVLNVPRIGLRAFDRDAGLLYGFSAASRYNWLSVIPALPISSLRIICPASFRLSASSKSSI